MKERSTLLVLAVCIIFSLSVSASTENRDLLPDIRYEIFELEDWGEETWDVHGISDSGTVYGIGTVRNGTGLYATGFVTYSDDEEYVIGTEMGMVHRPYGINRHDVIVGYTSSYDAFTYDRGALTYLDPLPGHDGASALGINNDAIVVGASIADEDVLHPEDNIFAVYWEDGEIHELPLLDNIGYSTARDINNAGTIVGRAGETHYEFHRQAAMWTDEGMTLIGQLAPGKPTDAKAINEDGDIVGWARPASGPKRAILIRDGEIIDISPDWGSLDQYGAHDINDQGIIVGEWGFENGAVVWIDEQAYNLNDLVPDKKNWLRLGKATGINNRGWIIGWGLQKVAEYPGTDWKGFLLIPVDN